MELTIDPKYGDGLIAANEKTLKDLGLSYKGKEVILDVRLGDNVLGCNQRTFDSLQEVPVEPVKVPKLEDIVEPDTEPDQPVKLSKMALYALSKKSQVELLESYGLSKADIRKLRTEKRRVETLLDLQGD